jgi:hypothetical protein
MPRNGKDPAESNRWAFYKLKWTSQIVAPLDPEAKCFLPQLAHAYREALTSEDPRVIRLGLQLLWRNRQYLWMLHGGGE